MKKVMWSKNRPKKPSRDTNYLELVKMLQSDGRSTFMLADKSGLSTSTIRNWTLGNVRHPQAVSLQMAARVFGYELTLVKKK